jgi:hypothetical protein
MRAIESGKGGGSVKTKRFWKDVHVKQADGMELPIFRPILLLRTTADD